MNDDSKKLYLFGGITAILSGILMVLISIGFLVQTDRWTEVMHGVSIVTLILVVPTFIAATVLLIKDAKTGVLLGVGFAVLWIGLGLIAHCSQTAPLKTLNAITQQTTAIGDFKTVWLEWGEALTLIGAFCYSVSAFCYGLSLRSWGNSASGYLLIFSAIIFAATFVPKVDLSLNWHILVRGLAIIFLGGVLLLAARATIDAEWEA